jgi:hypothetical protein
MPRNGPRIKVRLNLKIEDGLKGWAMLYARKHGTTVTKIITDYLGYLRKQEQREDVDCVEQV